MRSGSPALAVLAGLCAALAAGTEAHAATATAGCDGPHTCGITYAAAPGEANRLTLTTAARGQVRVVRFADTGAPVTAGAGCRQITAHRAACRYPSFESGAAVELGDGRDQVTAPAGTRLTAVGIYAGPGADRIDASAVRTSATLDGGGGDDVILAARGGGSLWGQAGSDELIGGPGRDDLDGGAGADRLVGRAGGDELEGGAGRDRLAGGRGYDALDGDWSSSSRSAERPGDDVIDGGPGRDTVAYSYHPGPITLDLASGRAAGPAGERDRLTGIERATGTPFADTLRGDAGPNVLNGGPLRAGLLRGDVLEGRGGDDELGGTSGRDTLRGGRGDDLVFPVRAVTRPAPSARPDDVRCGPGADEVLPAPLTRATAPVVPRSCERIVLREPRVGLLGPVYNIVSLGRPRTTPAGVTIDALFPGPTRKDGRLEFSARGGTAYGTASWTADASDHTTLKVTLNAAGRTAAAAHEVAVIHAVPFVPPLRDPVTADWAIAL